MAADFYSLDSFWPLTTPYSVFLSLLTQMGKNKRKEAIEENFYLSSLNHSRLDFSPLCIKREVPFPLTAHHFYFNFLRNFHSFSFPSDFFFFFCFAF